MSLIHFRFAVVFFLVGMMTVPLAAQQPLTDERVTSREKDPVLRADDGELFFSRVDDPDNKGKDNASDIWIRTRYPDGSWGRALNPGSPVNSFAHDRALALNADGTRLAVLRNGLTNYIDLLERKERNWRIIESWPVPPGVYPRLDLTFDINAQRLIYSAYGSGGLLDLYERSALPDGKWASEKPLVLLNGADNTTNPQMAADGRTLYFRRSDQWWRQTSEGRRAEVTNIPARILQFAAGVNSSQPAVVMYDDLGGEERLLTQRLGTGDLPEPSTLVRGYLNSPPSPGSTTALVRLHNGDELPVYPDALQRYEIFLRAGEELPTNAANATAATAGAGNTNGLATLGSTTLGSDQDRLRLEESIAAREQALQKLDAERRRFDLAAPKTSDPELDALRARYDKNTGVVDTLPPTGNTVRDKYARELSELERMKAKFRRQQDDKLRQRSGSRSHTWTDKNATPAATPTTAGKEVTIPSIDKSYTPPVRKDPREIARQAYRDSLRLDARVRSGLYPDRTPPAYEREAWENQVRRDLPRTEPISNEESARLDAQYQQQQDELEAMRAKLHRMNETTPPAQQQPARTWTAKGQPAAPVPPAQPATYGRTQYPPVAASPPRATPPASTARPGISAGISFIPNTAYPDGAGYTGLDQLVKQLLDQGRPLEVRVHTPVDLDRRAAQLLSEERAVSVRNYLLENAVPAHLFQVIGFGNNLTGSGGERVEVLLK